MKKRNLLLITGLLLLMSNGLFAQSSQGEVETEEEEEILIEDEDGNVIQEEEILIEEDEEIVVEEDDLEEEIIEEEESDDLEIVFKQKIVPEWSGSVRGDFRYYPKEALYEGQEETYFSSVFKPELYMEWDGGAQLIQFTGFARLNQYDTQQTHADIRELYYQRVFKKWEVSAGVKKIYWGFTESNHLVNIVNQDDVLEGNDIENKLGQPMLHVSSTQKWGVLDFMLMTYFRELQFPGFKGRARPPFELDNSAVTFESDAKEYNPDVAIRWSHSIRSVDLGLSHFYGTSRLPLFDSEDGEVFSPSYELIHQTGLELQATTGAMLWKLEGIHRESKRKTISAYTIGGEYTFSNVFKADVGVLVEYNYDDRGAELITALNDDIFIGMRIAVNDKQSTDFLGGVNIDRVKGTTTYFVEANRRLGETWKLSIEALGFENIHQSEFLYLIRNDGYVQMSLAHYF